MKFACKRTSSFGGNRPCEEARQEKYVNNRGAKDFRWIVDMGTLNELMEFCEKYGPVIIPAGSFDFDDLPVIEIYDDYRE